MRRSVSFWSSSVEVVIISFAARSKPRIAWCNSVTLATVADDLRLILSIPSASVLRSPAPSTFASTSTDVLLSDTDFSVFRNALVSTVAFSLIPSALTAFRSDLIFFFVLDLSNLPIIDRKSLLKVERSDCSCCRLFALSSLAVTGTVSFSPIDFSWLFIDTIDLASSIIALISTCRSSNIHITRLSRIIIYISFDGTHTLHEYSRTNPHFLENERDSFWIEQVFIIRTNFQ